MAVGPEFVKRTGVRIGERRFAENIEGTDGGSLRIGDEAVDGLLTVHVGGMLVDSAVPIL